MGKHGAAFKLNSVPCLNSECSQTVLTEQGEVVKVPFLHVFTLCCHVDIFSFLSISF